MNGPKEKLSSMLITRLDKKVKTNCDFRNGHNLSPMVYYEIRLYLSPLLLIVNLVGKV